jgi:hypothetical protein
MPSLGRPLRTLRRRERGACIGLRTGRMPVARGARPIESRLKTHCAVRIEVSLLIDKPCSK